MTKKKKILIIVLIVLGLLILSVVGVAAAFLMRLNYISQEDQAAISQGQVDNTIELAPSPDYPLQTATPSDTPEPTLSPDELVVHEEIEQTELSEEEKALLEVQKNEGSVVNILLLGVDRRGKSGNSRSDTMLVATLDKPNKRMKLTSLMRDMYVPIPGHGSNRINSACATGGPGLVIKTINENFSLNIENYVLVDFNMFEDIVDMVGGVTIEMSKGEVAEANDCIAGLNKQRGASLRSGFIKQRGGDVTLTGKQALGYCRIRHFGNGDYARTSRQYKVLQAIFDKFKTLGAAEQLSVLYDVLPMVETDLSPTQIVSLASQALGMDMSTILHYRLPIEGKFRSKSIRGMSVLVPDIPANAKDLHDFLYNATEQQELPYTDTQKGSYYKKVPKTAEPEEEELPPDELDINDVPEDNGTENPVTSPEVPEEVTIVPDDIPMEEEDPDAIIPEE